MIIPDNYSDVFKGKSSIAKMRMLADTDIIELNIEPGNDDDLEAEEIDYSWEVVVFEPLSMAIQVLFTNAAHISSK